MRAAVLVTLLGMKTCSWCLVSKPLSEFSGTYNYCRPCHNNYEKARNPNRALIDEKRTMVAALAMQGLKRCTTCGIDKPYSDFGRDRRHKDGRQSRCIKCELARKYAARKPSQSRGMKRRSHLFRTYGITEEEYEELLTAQGGACAICGKKPSATRRLCVDHRHADGLVRGLICTNDNQNLLGVFKDNAALLRAAADYLDNPPAVKTIGERYVPGSPPRTLE
jgi:hypothetical protein